MKKPKIALDRVAAYIAALGVPGLVLVAVMKWSGYAGAAALTKALATLGWPLGMLAGIGTLLILSQVGPALTDFGFDVVFKAALQRLREQGLSLQEIHEKIDSCWFLSSKQKNELREYVDRWG